SAQLSTLFPYTTLFRSLRIATAIRCFSLSAWRAPARSATKARVPVSPAPSPYPLHDRRPLRWRDETASRYSQGFFAGRDAATLRSEEHTSELQSLRHLV